MTGDDVDVAPDTALPLNEVHTPTLDEWTTTGTRRVEGAWIHWVDPATEYRVDVETVDLLNTDADRATYAFEVELVDVTDRPRTVLLRETIHNSRLAVYAAEFVATHAEAFADGWDEGLAPRPTDVDP